MLVDGVEGPDAEPRPAFDHEAAARAITEATGIAADAERLPVLGWGVHDAGIRGTLAGGDHVIVVSDGVPSVVPLTGDPGFRANQTTRRRSRNGGDPSRLVIQNASAKTIGLSWVDQSGSARSYGTIDPGGEREQNTYAGHVWRVETDTGATLGYYEAAEGGSLVVVTGEETPLPQQERQRGPRGRDAAGRSPDGRWRVEIVGHNPVLIEAGSGDRHGVAADGTAGDRYEEPVYWSPDSSAFVIRQVVPAQDRTVSIVRSSPEGGLQPELMQFNYLKPGDRVARERYRLFRVEPDATRVCSAVPVSSELFDEPWTLGFPAWMPDGSAFTFLYNQRGHRVMRLVSIDAQTGATKAVIDERPDTFFDYAGKLFLRRFEHSDELVWMSERDGWNHLYLIDERSGRVIRQITRGDWLVRSVVSVDESARTILFRAVGVYPGQDPYHVHYGRVAIDSGAITWLTDGDGTHTLEFGEDERFYLDRYSHAERPPVTELRRASDGAKITTLAEGDWGPLAGTGWRAPERFVAKARDGETDIWGLIHYPEGYDPGSSYPVIESIYAGPHGHHVPKGFRTRHGVIDSLRERGFFVVQIDGMGTNWRSKAFHDVAWKNIGDSGFPDRIAWIKAAAESRPAMDITRVGIYGTSAGGQSALRALTHDDFSSFYDAAVADCGCHDNRVDKIWWNELWMSWPVGPHYEAQSNVTNAHKLRGDLLLMVGEIDKNVDPASTTQVVDALIRADKDFEFLLMPNVGHGCLATPYGRRRLLDFFGRTLLGPGG